MITFKINTTCYLSSYRQPSPFFLFYRWVTPYKIHCLKRQRILYVFVVQHLKYDYGNR